jgi:hypothetical protein
MSSPTTSPTTRPRRASKFTEGSPLTGPDILQRSPTSNQLFNNILSEMDEFDKKRKHRDSNTSMESLASSSGSNSSTSHPQHTSIEKELSSPKEGRRSITFGRPSRRSLEERPRVQAIDGEGHLGSKIKGRLRALTGGKDREVKPYEGT